MNPSHIIDLVFDTECPHVGEARLLLRRALSDAGLPLEWREWDRSAADTPAALRGLGSPTILVNGTDASGEDPVANAAEQASACRIYRHDDGLRGVPALAAVMRALAR